MAAKKQAKPRSVAVSAVLPDGSRLELAAPTQEQWDRYLDKFRRGEDRIGRRELVQVCCLSHQVDPATGHIAALEKKPALIKKLADGLDEFCGGGTECAVDIDAGTVTVEHKGETILFFGPDIDQWEKLQEDIENPKVPLGETLRRFVLSTADDRDAAQRLIADKCAAIQPLSNRLGEIAGAGISIEVKKD